jgi:hypothetical protein
MPLSKHVIDPKHIKDMRLAFQKVCDALNLTCDPDDPMTDLIVMKIIELAKAGEVDSSCICGRVPVSEEAGKCRSEWRQLKADVALTAVARSLRQFPVSKPMPVTA